MGEHQQILNVTQYRSGRIFHRFISARKGGLTKEMTWNLL